MKKLLSMIALAAICTGSVYAGPSTPVKAKTVVTDTVKKKVKTKNDTTKVKMKSKM
jgi:hypothetical protein